MDRKEERVFAGTTIVRKAVRSARLQVQPDGTLRVVAPASFNVEEFLQRNVAWIEEQRAKYDRLAAAGCGKEDHLLLHGEFYRVLPGAGFAIDETSGCVTFPSISILKRNLTHMLREEVNDRLRGYPDLVRRGSGRIAIKLQKTRWGSCSSLGNLNINLRIVALPETLREYIVIHEAAHLREQNHSARFWQLVETHYPEHRAAEAELRRYWVILERNSVWRSLQDVP